MTQMPRPRKKSRDEKTHTVIPLLACSLSLDDVFTQELCDFLRMCDLGGQFCASGGERAVLLKVLAGFGARGGEDVGVAYGWL